MFREKNMEMRGMTEDYKITSSLNPVYEMAELIAQNDNTTVFIQGETGTGKEHLARHIHEYSPRKRKPFETINCSAFGESLLESRLFGYMKGAFTGADEDQKGLFERTNGGTIFLDEIGDISRYMQQSLLRVIDRKEIQPIGGPTKKIDVRIISATNRNLPDMCRNGDFRWDLYYRLVVTELNLPTLLERGKKDIEEMINFFIVKKRIDLKKESPIILTKEAREFLQSYSWPGNLRELENLIEALYSVCDNEVRIEDIPARFKESSKRRSLNWQDIERDHINYVLRLMKGNQRQAWLALGYKSINTLRSKITEYEIEIDEL